MQAHFHMDQNIKVSIKQQGKYELWCEEKQNSYREKQYNKAIMHTHPCPESWLALKELQQLYMDYVQQGPEKRIIRSTTKHANNSTYC